MRSGRLEGKVAIVTGGANGIGRAIALLFAREGARIVVADRDVSAGSACVGAIAAAGGQGIFVETDVSRDESVAAPIEQTVAHYGGIDVLVNSAGISSGASVTNTEPERWRRVLDVNLGGVYLTCRYAIPHMITRGGGAIVNISSLQALFSWPGYAAYAASKAGMIGLTRQIAVEYAADGIRANLISPGGVVTQLGENSARLEPALAIKPVAAPRRTPGAGPPRVDDKILPGPIYPEHVAFAALFLACDESAKITGHNLIVDGGASTHVG